MKVLRFSPRTALVNLDHRVQLVISGIIVGILGGLASLGLNHSLHRLSHVLESYKHGWFVLLLAAAGLVSTILVLRYIFHDFKGHGIPEVIYSVSMKGGLLKLRSSLSKLVGSLLTISSGGSAGPEAPVAISGAAIGSNIATYFKANDKIRIAVTGSGAAAAIASIFNAPITGFMFSMEVILGEWTVTNMLPVALASVTGTVISRYFNGNQIPFGHRLIEVGINDILAAGGLSLLLAGFTVVFIKLLKATQEFLRRYVPNIFLRAALAGIAVGGVILFFPEVRGEGYELTRILITENYSLGLTILLVLIVMKITATSITLGGGGAGGVFAPSLVIGSLTGSLYHVAMKLVSPSLAIAGPGFFALCGMAGMVSGTLMAPLTGIFLILEITGGYDVILPLLVVAFLTPTLVRLLEKNSIYAYELVEKGYLRRPRTDARILTDIRTTELLEKDLQTVHPEMILDDLVPLIITSHRNYFPVLEPKSGSYLGMVELKDIKPYIFNPALRRSIIIEEVMRKELPTISINESMMDILNKFDISKAWSLPVVDGDKFLGLVSKSAILDHYRKELKAQTED